MPSPSPPAMSGGFVRQDSRSTGFEAQTRGNSFLQRQPKVDRNWSADGGNARLTSPSVTPPSMCVSPSTQFVSPSLSVREPPRHQMSSSPRAQQAGVFEAVFMSAEPGTGGTAGCEVLDGLVIG